MSVAVSERRGQKQPLLQVLTLSATQDIRSRLQANSGLPVVTESCFSFWLQLSTYTWCYISHRQLVSLLMQTPHNEKTVAMMQKSSLCQEGLFLCCTVALSSVEIPVAPGCFILVYVKYPAVPFKTDLFSI